MSFGASNTTKQANNNLSGTSNLALNSQFPAVTSAGSGLLSEGNNTAAPGINYFKSLLGGNQANTAATLQPNIDQIRQGTSNNLNAISTLMPRSGARYAGLFNQSLSPQAQIQNLFNGARTSAATALPQIGMQQQGMGVNLFGLGNGALQAATGANSNLMQSGLQQQQMSNNMISGLASGLFGLATLPFGGGAAKNGLLGLI